MICPNCLGGGIVWPPISDKEIPWKWTAMPCPVCLGLGIVNLPNQDEIVKIAREDWS